MFTHSGSWPIFEQNCFRDLLAWLSWQTELTRFRLKHCVGVEHEQRTTRERSVELWLSKVSKLLLEMYRQAPMLRMKYCAAVTICDK
jgi:hypothetical protein